MLNPDRSAFNAHRNDCQCQSKEGKGVNPKEQSTRDRRIELPYCPFILPSGLYGCDEE